MHSVRNRLRFEKRAVARLWKSQSQFERKRLCRKYLWLWNWVWSRRLLWWIEYFYAYSEDDERIEISRFKNKELAKKYYQQEKAEAEQEIKTLKAEIEYYEAALKHCKNELDSEEIEFLQDAILENKKEILECEKELELSGVSGVYVWQGTKYAIKDTK